MSENTSRAVGTKREVTLDIEHKHGGRWRQPGEKIKAFPHTIERLERQGKVRGSTAKKSASAGE